MRAEPGALIRLASLTGKRSIRLVEHFFCRHCWINPVRTGRIKMCVWKQHDPECFPICAIESRHLTAANSSCEKSTKPSHRACGRRLRVEPLEPRLVLDSTVVFNEIMYHPAGTDDTLEWIELHNRMAVEMDLSKWSAEDGIPACSLLH